MSNIIVQGNEINAKQYVEKITIEGIGEEKTLNPRIVVALGGLYSENIHMNSLKEITATVEVIQ